jgi:hypothetical protein
MYIDDLLALHRGLHVGKTSGSGARPFCPESPPWAIHGIQMYALRCSLSPTVRIGVTGLPGILESAAAIITGQVLSPNTPRSPVRNRRGRLGLEMECDDPSSLS